MSRELGGPSPEELDLQQQSGKDFNQMGFQELEQHPHYGKALQEQALSYLRNKDSGYFDREFSGELDADGYLIKKDGTTSNTKPSQNIGGGEAMAEVERKTKEELKRRPPA